MKTCLGCKHLQVNPTRYNGLPLPIAPLTEGATLCLHPSCAKVLPSFLSGGEGEAVLNPSIEIARTIGACGEEAVLWEASDD